MKFFIALLLLFSTNSFAGVADGQAVNAAVTNAAFLDSTVDDTATGILTLNNVDVESGSSVANIQREFNALNSYLGSSLNQHYSTTPVWTANEGFASSTEDVTVRVEAISATLDKDTGHAHDGTDGAGGTIAATDLSGLFGAVVQVDGSEGSAQSVVAASGVTFSSDRVVTHKFIVGDGATDVSANPQIAAGSSVGQVLVLIGTDNTNYVLIEDGNGVGSNGPAEIGDGKVWSAVWSGSVWRELWRSF